MNLKFGTGGLRATMAPGPDHMNLETIQEATLLGAKGFIYKPFEADEVLKTLDSIFAE